MYRYDETVGDAISTLLGKFVNTNGIFIGDYERDPDDIYFNMGSGTDSVGFKINQSTGTVEVRYTDPETDNEWEAYSGAIVRLLQKHVVKQSGGKRKTRCNKRRNTKTRKSK